MSQIFLRKKENFKCFNCQNLVYGNGYTNHCPKCLWSRHVDVNPGDRINKCKGEMKPINIEFKSNQYLIFHQCLKCGLIKRVKAVSSDDIEGWLSSVL